MKDEGGRMKVGNSRQGTEDGKLRGERRGVSPLIPFLLTRCSLNTEP